MRGLGTVVNVVAIVAGTFLGLLIGPRVTERMRTTVLQCLGLSTLALGVHDALTTQNLVFPIGALVVGAVIGELLSIEERLESIGDRIRRRVRQKDDSTFVEGFVSASLLYCIGPLALLGPISDGLGRGIDQLAVKSALDGVVSVIFASTLGIGVAFSALSVGFMQAAVTVLAGVADRVLTDRMVTEMTATGGLMIIGIGVRLLELKKVRVGSFLPALVIAPLAVALFAR